MTSAAATRDNLLPRPPAGMGAGALLALLVHAGLVVAIAFGVNWRTSAPAGLEAELWSSVPQVAAPPAAAAEPVARPAPPPKAEAPPEPKAEPKAEPPDPQIALEREKKKRLDEERDRREKAEQLAKAKAEREKTEREQREADKLAASREAQLQRIQQMAGGSGTPTSTGTAAQTAGPSATYAGRIKARIKPNVLFNETVSGNPLASVEVRAAADGTIVGRRLLRSSGVPAWDEAVLRAIDKTDGLPRDTDGRVPPTIVIDFLVRE